MTGKEVVVQFNVIQRKAAWIEPNSLRRKKVWTLI